MPFSKVVAAPRGLAWLTGLLTAIESAKISLNGSARAIAKAPVCSRAPIIEKLRTSDSSVGHRPSPGTWNSACVRVTCETAIAEARKRAPEGRSHQGEGARATTEANRDTRA